MLKNSRTIIGFILGVLAIIYIGTISDMKYQEKNTYAYDSNNLVDLS